MLQPLPELYQSCRGGPCVGKILNLFLHSTRSLENLSSGENLAGCAENVGDPSGAFFCMNPAANDSSTIPSIIVRVTHNYAIIQLLLH